MNFIYSLFAELNKTMTTYYQKSLYKIVMPMLAFRNTRLTYVDAYLSVVLRMDKFCKTTTVVLLHLQRIGNLLLR